MARTEQLVVPALAVTLVFFTLACGGGAGGGTAAYTNATFSGPYVFGNFEGGASPEQSTTSWGRITSNGLGQVTSVTGSNNNEGAIGILAVPPYPYAVGPGGVLTLQTGGGVTDMRGGISADGRMAIAGGILAGDDPTLLFMTRQTGAFSTASLNGRYHVCWFSDRLPGTDGDGTRWGVADFNGSGRVDYLLEANYDGSVLTVPAVFDSYSVLANGTLLLADSGQDFAGCVLPGGDIAFVCGGVSATGVRALAVFIRLSPAASLATFTGPYTVSVDGKMTLDTGYDLQGGVASDGSVAVFAGSTVDTHDIQFWIFVR